jgi:hypothetical protein
MIKNKGGKSRAGEGMVKSCRNESGQSKIQNCLSFIAVDYIMKEELGGGHLF